MSGFVQSAFDRVRRKKTAPPPSPPTNNPSQLWDTIQAGLNREDLLQIIDDCSRYYGSDVQCLAATTFLERHHESVTMRELDRIMTKTYGSTAWRTAARLIVDRATHKDELGQVVVSGPDDLRAEAGRRTLALNPEPHDISRCLHIPVLRDEAIRLLTRDSTPRSYLQHYLWFERAVGNGQDLREAIMSYLTRSGRRIDLSPAVEAALRAAGNTKLQ